MNIFEKTKGQFIDDCGRLRMLTYEHTPIVLFTPPLHPLNIERLPKYNLDKLPKFEQVSQFIGECGFEVVGYHRYENKDRVDGVWLRLNLKSTGLSSSYYIPFEPKHRNPDDEIVDGDPPLWILTRKTYLTNTDKVADVIMNILKQVTARLCAILGELPLPCYFVPKEKYIENILERLNDPEKPSFLYFDDDSDSDLLFDSEQRIYIPIVDETLGDELVKNLINHASLVMMDLTALQDAAHKQIVNGSYTYISSFRESSDFCVFETMQEILDYKNMKDGNMYKIQGVPDSNTSNPYILCHPYITNGRVAIIQNARDYEAAGYIVTSWKQSKYNPGFDGPKDDLKLSLGIQNTFQFINENADLKLDHLPEILIYEDNSYAAILYS